MESNEFLLEKFISSLQARSMASNTIIAYQRDLEDFFSYCEANQLQLQDIEASDLRSWIGHRIADQHKSSSTVRRQVASIRQFMQWATLNKFLVNDNSQDIQVKRRSEYLPQALEVDLIMQLLDQPDPVDPNQLELWHRDKAIMELFYSTGMRLNELYMLNVGGLNYSTMLVRVVGKGNKERIIPFGRKASEAIRVWMGVYQTWLGREVGHADPLFVSRHGTRLSVSQIGRRITAQATRAGIDTNIHPHLFRHSFATHMLSGAGDIRAVQEMLGHSSLATTQIYTHLDFNTLAKSYDNAHPRAYKPKS